MKLFFTSCLCVLFLPLLHGQGIKQRVDDYLMRELQKFNVPNMEVIVVSRDSVLYTKSIGEATDPHTPYYLGSVSKSLTAFGVLTLVENGRLKLDQPVTTLLPTLHVTGGSTPLTVRHLLNHTSGIAKKAGFGALPPLPELERAGFSLATAPQPGQKHEYSNLNYALLGLIIEKVSGRTFQQYMQEQVFAPMGMDHTFSGSSAQNETRVVAQYQYWGPFPVKSRQADYALTAVPAGFICSSAADMGKYLQANLNKGTVGTRRVLDSGLVAALHTPWAKGKTGYAMGWNQGSYNGKRLLQHLGSTATSYSAIFILPDDNLGVAVLTNSNSLGFSESLVEGIVSIVTGGEAHPASVTEWYGRWLVALLTLFLAGRLVYQVALLLRTGRAHPATMGKAVRSLAVAIGCFVGFVFLLPTIAHVPFLSLLKLQPDIGCLVLLALGSPVVTKLIWTGQVLRAPSPPKG
ncbi:serine hydrolase [Hymenobacter seoulensis]